MATRLETDYAVSQLRPEDRDRYRAFLLSLDRDTRRNRFSGTVSDEFILRHLERAFGNGVIVHVCRHRGTLVGAAELHLPEDGIAEAAFAVEPAHRNQGIGSRLLKAVLMDASDRGDRVISVRCLRSNAAMRRLAQKAQAHMKITLDEVEGEITPPPIRPLRQLVRYAGGRLRSMIPFRQGASGRVIRNSC